MIFWKFSWIFWKFPSISWVGTNFSCHRSCVGTQKSCKKMIYKWYMIWMHPNLWYGKSTWTRILFSCGRIHIMTNYNLIYSVHFRENLVVRSRLSGDLALVVFFTVVWKLPSFNSRHNQMTWSQTANLWYFVYLSWIERLHSMKCMTE